MLQQQVVAPQHIGAEEGPLSPPQVETRSTFGGVGPELPYMIIDNNGHGFDQNVDNEMMLLPVTTVDDTEENQGVDQPISDANDSDMTVKLEEYDSENGVDQDGDLDFSLSCNAEDRDEEEVRDRDMRDKVGDCDE